MVVLEWPPDVWQAVVEVMNGEDPIQAEWAEAKIRALAFGTGGNPNE